jgi:hypothetical protein
MTKETGSEPRAAIDAALTITASTMAAVNRINPNSARAPHILHLSFIHILESIIHVILRCKHGRAIASVIHLHEQLLLSSIVPSP